MFAKIGTVLTVIKLVLAVGSEIGKAFVANRRANRSKRREDISKVFNKEGEGKNEL